MMRFNLLSRVKVSQTTTILDKINYYGFSMYANGDGKMTIMMVMMVGVVVGPMVVD